MTGRGDVSPPNRGVRLLSATKQTPLPVEVSVVHPSAQGPSTPGERLAPNRSSRPMDSGIVHSISIFISIFAEQMVSAGLQGATS